MFVLLRELQRLKRHAELPKPSMRGSLALRHVDAGSCNGCEHELTATANPYYDLPQYGLSVVASPRHADVLLVTGPITTRMLEPLRTAYEAMPEPRLVAAVGDCALGCNLPVTGTNWSDRLSRSSRSTSAFPAVHRHRGRSPTHSSKHWPRATERNVRSATAPLARDAASECGRAYSERGTRPLSTRRRPSRS